MQHFIFHTYVLGIVLVFAGVGAEPPCFADEGRIVVRVLGEDDQVTPVRAWVTTSRGRVFEPVSPDTATPYARDRSFSCDGTFTMVVPAGKAIVHIEKGKEFLPVDVEVVVPSGESVEKTIRIVRWVDMPDRGWYSADLHVHLGYNDPRILRQLALADDVHLIPSFTYWLRGRGETWCATWPDETYGRPIVVDDQHVVTRDNIEIERIDGRAAAGGAVGATFLFNLRQPVTAAQYGEHYPTDAALCRVARQHSPASVFDSDKPSWAETVLVPRLGALDTVQLCHNHYHRSSTIPGGWGMIGPLAPGESNAAVGDGLFHRTNALYYRFLNCGFRLGVSGGSAIGVMPVPAGFHRVYANIEGPLNAEKLWAAIKDGRTFATTGPMLTLTADGQGIGSTISMDSARPQPVTVRTTVQSIEALETLEIIHDGYTVASRNLLQDSPDPFLEADLEFELTPQRSGWFGSRVLYRAPDGLLRQAHTSPIYISVDGKPTASAADVRYMLCWLDRLIKIAESQRERFPDAEVRNGVLETYAEARARYEEIVAVAQRHWGE